MSFSYSYDLEIRLYDLNMRDHDAIIEIDAFDNVIRHTSDEFESEEEFRRVKEWSDGNYRETYLAKRKERYRTEPTDSVPEELLTVDSVEEQVIASELDAERDALSNKILALCNTVLTKTQRERLLLSVCGYTVEEISRMLGITHQNVSKSIVSAKALLRRYMEAGKK